MDGDRIDLYYFVVIFHQEVHYTSVRGSSQPESRSLVAGVLSVLRKGDSSLDKSLWNSGTCSCRALKWLTRWNGDVFRDIGDKDFGDRNIFLGTHYALKRNGALLTCTIRFQVSVVSNPALIEGLFNFIASWYGRFSHGCCND